MKNLEKLSKNLFNAVLNGSKGGTLCPLTGNLVEFSTGYIYGIQGFNVPLTYFINAKYPIKILAEYIVSSDLMSNFLYIGFWVNNNIVYIDCASHNNDLKSSLLNAKKCNQLTIWDCSNKKTINV